MRKFYKLLFITIISVSVQTAFAYGNEGNESVPSITVLSADTDVSIYPNPVKNYATIEFSAGVDNIVIMNIVGKEVISFTPEKDTKEMKVNLTELQPGVYFIAAYSNGVKLITKRFMKEQ